MTYKTVNLTPETYSQLKNYRKILRSERDNDELTFDDVVQALLKQKSIGVTA